MLTLAGDRPSGILYVEWAETAPGAIDEWRRAEKYLFGGQPVHQAKQGCGQVEGFRVFRGLGVLARHDDDRRVAERGAFKGLISRACSRGPR
jgi:hypothetical protein